VVVAGLDLEVAAVEPAGSAAQATADHDGEIGLDGRVGARAAGHRDGTNAVELGLPLLPGEEFGQRHRIADSKSHRKPFYIIDTQPTHRRGGALERSPIHLTRGS
jgi:hypothetical protein